MTAPAYRMRSVWSTRESQAESEPAPSQEGTDIQVTIQSPGTYVSDPPACLVRVELREGPGALPRREPDVADIDLFVDELDRFLATLAAAIAEARRAGTLDGPHP